MRFKIEQPAQDFLTEINMIPQADWLVTTWLQGLVMAGVTKPMSVNNTSNSSGMNLKHVLGHMGRYNYNPWHFIKTTIHYYYKMTVWIWAGNDNFAIATGLIKLHMPGVK